MRTVHFFIDNLAIGGFQRLCLDQSYAFAAAGNKVNIHVLSEVSHLNSNTFVNLEKSIISKFDISINSLSSSHLGQLKKTSQILGSVESDDLVISHSLRATVILWFSKHTLRKKTLFITTIHQLPTLSAPIQRTRRFIYSQFSPILTAYSTAVKNDWDSRVLKNYLFRIFFRKQISVLRNGIFLDRLPRSAQYTEIQTSKRLVYLGRNTGWKGIETLLRYATLDSLQDFEILLMLPEIDITWEKELRNKFGGRIEISTGKTLSSYVPRNGDVHFYAAQYGPNAKFIEGISLNCLEMAALGVPSLVTSGGLGTWPDLEEKKIFVECEWDNLNETSDKIRLTSELIFSSLAINEICKLVDIKNNISIIEASLGSTRPEN